MPDDPDILKVRGYNAKFFEFAEKPVVSDNLTSFSEVINIHEEIQLTSCCTNLQDVLEFLEKQGNDLQDMVVSFYSALYSMYVKCEERNVLINLKDLETINGKYALRLRFEMQLEVNSDSEDDLSVEPDEKKNKEEEKEGTSKEASKQEAME
jgi:hypothetical protein